MEPSEVPQSAPGDSSRNEPLRHVGQVTLTTGLADLRMKNGKEPWHCSRVKTYGDPPPSSALDLWSGKDIEEDPDAEKQLLFEIQRLDHEGKPCDTEFSHSGRTISPSFALASPKTREYSETTAECDTLFYVPNGTPEVVDYHGRDVSRAYDVFQLPTVVTTKRGGEYCLSDTQSQENRRIIISQSLSRPTVLLAKLVSHDLKTRFDERGEGTIFSVSEPEDVTRVARRKTRAYSGGGYTNDEATAEVTIFSKAEQPPTVASSASAPTATVANPTHQTAQPSSGSGTEESAKRGRWKRVVCGMMTCGTASNED